MLAFATKKLLTGANGQMEDAASFVRAVLIAARRAVTFRATGASHEVIKSQ